MSATPEERLVMAIFQSGCIRCERGFESTDDTTVVDGMLMHMACLTEDDKLYGNMTYPLRQKSAGGQPKPNTTIERACKACGASFLGLAPGKTGERGIWTNEHWYCSTECNPDPT